MNTPKTISSLEMLLQHVEENNQPKYLFFWGHTPPKDGSINQSCFSQWFTASFGVNGENFRTAENYMMVGKARLFDDEAAAQKILKAKTPSEAKALGRTVKDFDDEAWKAERFKIVVQANLEKFSQNPELLDYLCTTGDHIIVEASPPDRIWGIGLAKDNPMAQNPKTWRGLNLLGFALMVVRDQLKNR